jgi:hypothetical protein
MNLIQWNLNVFLLLLLLLALFPYYTGHVSKVSNLFFLLIIFPLDVFQYLAQPSCSGSSHGWMIIDLMVQKYRSSFLVLPWLPYFCKKCSYNDLILCGYSIYWYNHLARERLNGGVAVCVRNSLHSETVTVRTLLRAVPIRICLATLMFTLNNIYLPPDTMLVFRSLDVILQHQSIHMLFFQYYLFFCLDLSLYCLGLSPYLTWIEANFTCQFCVWTCVYCCHLGCYRSHRTLICQTTLWSCSLVARQVPWCCLLEGICTRNHQIIPYIR